MRDQALQVDGNDDSPLRGDSEATVRSPRSSLAPNDRAAHTGGVGNGVIDIELARRLYETDERTMPEIAHHFGVSKQAVHKALTEAGVQARSREEVRAQVLEKQYPQTFRDQAMRRCEQIGITAAARELHVSRQTLKSWGAKGRPRTKPKISWVEIADRYRRGESPYQIAPDAGIHPNVIAQKLRAGGLRMRTRGEANRLAAARRRTENEDPAAVAP